MSNSQYLTPELRDWVAAQLRNGITREALYQAMLTSGWQPDMAQQALAEHRPFEPPLTLPANIVDVAVGWIASARMRPPMLPGPSHVHAPREMPAPASGGCAPRMFRTCPAAAINPLSAILPL